jgi:hypothetical protein
LPARVLEYIAWLGFALTGALLILGATEAEVIVLEHPHRHSHGLRAVVDDVGARNDLRQMLANGVAHFLIVTEPVARAARKQLVPLREPERSTTAAFVHCLSAYLS